MEPEKQKASLCLSCIPTQIKPHLASSPYIPPSLHPSSPLLSSHLAPHLNSHLFPSLLIQPLIRSATHPPIQPHPTPNNHSCPPVNQGMWLAVLEIKPPQPLLPALGTPQRPSAPYPALSFVQPLTHYALGCFTGGEERR